MVSEPDATIQAAAIDEVSAPIAFKPDTLRRVAVTAVVLTISTLLTYVPAPGLSPEAIAHVTSPTGGGVEISRLSIVALGLSPILSALIAGEFLKLAAPSLYGLEDNSSRAHTFNRAVLILGLFFAAFQAYGITVALEQIQLTGGTEMVDEPDAFFRLSYMMTLVAGVALTYWLAEIVTRHGIGSGFWVMILAGEIGTFPTVMKLLADNHAAGQIGTEALLILIIVIAAAVFSIVALYRLRFMPAASTVPVGQIAPRDIMMPPLLGSAIASTLMMVVPLGQYLTGDDSTPANSFDPVRLILGAAMILLIAYLRAATRPLRGLSSAQAIRWSLIAGAITAAITVALEILGTGIGHYLISGTWLIILIVVCLIFLSSQREQPASDQAEVTTNAQT